MGILNSFIQFNKPAATTGRSSASGKAAIAKSNADGKQTPIVLQRGEVVRGEVIDLRSKEVTVRLQDGRTLNAKLADASALYIGQKADFFVQETTDSVILLRLLPDGDTTFAENTINKALEAAGLPKTAHTMAIVSALLEENMPVSKEHIRQFMQLASQNREASFSTLALLTKHNLPLTKENIRQFEAFRNYEHRLTEQITTLSDTLASLAAESSRTESSTVTPLQKQLLSLLAEPIAKPAAEPISDNASVTINAKSAVDTAITSASAFGEAVLSERTVASENVLADTSAPFSTQAVSDAKIELTALLEGDFSVPATDTGVSSTTDTPTAQSLQEAGIAVLHNPEFKEASYVFSTLNAFLSKEEGTLLSGKLQALLSDINVADTNDTFLQAFDSDFIQQTADGTLEISRFFSAMTSLAEEFPHAANALFRDTTYQGLFTKALSKHFLLTPQELLEEQAISNYYERLETELSAIKHTLDRTQNSSAADSAKQMVSNMQDNVQFMNSLNSLFPYVQLPLKFMEQTSHGELYVYTKKRELAQNGASISVLLHLDMNHLGPVDIHLALTGKSVVAKFYLEEELSKQLTQNNLPFLSDALAKKGYSLSSEVLTRETKPDPVKEFMQDTQAPLMKRYTFDIRA